MQLGPSVPFASVVILWVCRTFVLSAICTTLALLGVRVLDSLTPSIHKREKIGEDPFAVGLFIGGFFIFLGLVIHGAQTAPMAVGGSLLSNILDFRRFSLIALSFVASLLLGILLFRVLDRLTPRIPFMSIRESSRGISAYVFGYLVFFGLITNAALSTPL